MPASWTPYVQLARIDRPIGWQLLLLPCWWSAALAGVALGRGPDWVHVLLFLIGAIAMRGAGSTWNDFVDRKIDAQVERTRHRPLASGALSAKQALVFVVGLSLVGAFVLFSLNWFAVGVGLASLLVVAIYPFAKRFTFWPQAVLGLAFAWGGLMGWAAAFGSLGAPAFLIYACAIFWTIGYDTIYALQDARDDAIVGVRSTARLFGDNVRLGVGLFYALAAIAGFFAIWLAGGGFFAFAGLAGFCAHMAWQLAVVRVGDPPLALRLFRANRDAGLILFAGLALDGMLKAWS
ncbi:MAG: 4-hydroxybenzoate octaprenyltransferase [Beijerinckiaceae bacterium]|nr:4-hydroxybenzoate octaprenyltransferase [Beijerinckiaceae bacterium]